MNFENRFIKETGLTGVIETFVVENVDSSIHIKTIGYSISGQPIHLMRIGHGAVKILMWSQMHGNESTGTRALLSLIEQQVIDRYQEVFTLYIIPILNPDGALLWSRVNQAGVDLNRDAVNLSQPESQILMQQYQYIKPDYCFNLHDQRTFYGTDCGGKPIGLSFLAAAFNLARDYNTVRKITAGIIGGVSINPLLNASQTVGRYSDDFNVNCFGDYLIKDDCPTILFEAGQGTLDYNRSESTRLVKIALTSTLDIIASKSFNQETVENYIRLPLVEKSFTDILLINVPAVGGKRVNLAVMYHEEVRDGTLYFIPFVVGVNAKEILNGLRKMDCQSLDCETLDINIDHDGFIFSNQLNINIFS
ncbi:MAG: M14 family zinc carboxypeptidase [Nonlabens sp.]